MLCFPRTRTRRTERERERIMVVERAEARLKKEEMKKELEVLLAMLMMERGRYVDTYDVALRTLGALQALEPDDGEGGDRAERHLYNSTVVPEFLVCPLSKELMLDPVLVSSGETYDRRFIQAWLDAGHRLCPKTKEVLLHSTLIPNNDIAELIKRWANSECIDVPPNPTPSSPEGPVTRDETNQIRSLFRTISISSTPGAGDVNKAVSQLKQLTDCKPQFRAHIGENPEAISQLITVMFMPKFDSDLQFQEAILATLMNLSMSERGKKVLGDHPQVIPLLIVALKADGIEMGRKSAASALFHLSDLYPNKVKIGELGAMEPLIKLFTQGSNEAAEAIQSLCSARENWIRAIRDGALKAALNGLRDCSLTAVSLAILWELKDSRHAMEEMMLQEHRVRRLVMLTNDGGSGGLIWKRAVGVLRALRLYDEKQLKAILGPVRMTEKTVVALLQHAEPEGPVPESDKLVAWLKQTTTVDRRLL